MTITIESLQKIWNQWEIQLVVLLSFTLQMFLFFTGCIRRYSTNALLRLLIWLAYVGADMVAVYALGLISQNDQSAGSNGLTAGTPGQLAFFWAPFLLIHLGGQDTLTAFSIEDNNLWLRHLLNLTIQVSLALYAFWKSVGGRNQRLLAPAILVFVAGIIRYGERTWALKCGSRNGLKETSLPPLPKLNLEVDKDSYTGTICYVLDSMVCIRDLFSGRTISHMKERHVFRFQADRLPYQVPKLLEAELAMMYDDLYTKAMVLRTRTGVMLRCISQVTMIAAFVLFLVGNKQEYTGADVAITYVLFIGGLGLEVCAFFPTAMSPWTWAFFKARKCDRLARISWLLLSSNIGWPEKKPLWSNSMGQYNFLSSCMGREQPTSSSKLLTIIRKMLNAVETMSFVRNLRHTKNVKVSKDVMDSVVTWVARLAREEFTRMTQQQQHWVNLRPIIDATLNSPAGSFGDNIILLHTYTELHLRKRSGSMDARTLSATMEICRKISSYMVYLLVAQPSMLPLSGTAEDTLTGFYDKITKNGSSKQHVLDTAYHLVEDKLEFGFEECLKEQEEPGPWHETLVEIQDMWMRLLLYSAGKCPAELHAQQLGRGGELLTFVWLLMGHYGIGEVGQRVELITDDETMAGPFCAFHFPKKSEHMSP